MASLGRVADLSTAVLMAQFYANRGLADYDDAVALALAQPFLLLASQATDE